MTPKTTALFERQFEDKFGTDKDHWEEMTEHARQLERENARLKQKYNTAFACVAEVNRIAGTAAQECIDG